MKHAFAFLLALGAAACAACAPRAPATLLRIGPDGTATVEGTVLENNLGCTHDLACFLRLDLDGADLRIDYHRGESPPCLDRNVARQGVKIAPGTRVRAAGRYRRAGALHVLDVCMAPGAVLTALPPG